MRLERSTVIVSTIVACSVAAAILILGQIYPALFYSPGGLSKDHRRIKNCWSCHEKWYGVQNSSCVSCHDKKPGLHVKDGVGSCADCHIEHKRGKGKRQRKIVFSYNHKTGSNNDKCLRCHTEPKDKLHGNISDGCFMCHKNYKKWTHMVFNHKAIDTKHMESCSLCHQNVKKGFHKYISSKKCADCHRNSTEKAFRFNHNDVSVTYQKKCNICHKSPGGTFHRSVGLNCADCHKSYSWLKTNFKHTFPINHGKRRKKMSCLSCHPKNNFRGYSCFSCHSARSIRGEHREEGVKNLNNCVRCHRRGREEEHD